MMFAMQSMELNFRSFTECSTSFNLSSLGRMSWILLSPTGTFWDIYASPAETTGVLLVLGVFLLAATLLVGALGCLARLLGTSMAPLEDTQVSSYECGFQPFERLDHCQLLLFYRLAVLFVVFEAEVIFLYPWGLSQGGMLWVLPTFFVVLPFLAVLLLGFLYEVQESALNL